MEIRPASFIDVPALLAIANTSPHAGQWKQSHYVQLVSSADAIVLIASAERACGFAAGNMAGDDCELENIVVSAEHQRQGIASALLQQFLSEARRRKASRVLLEVRESNDAPRKLYMKFGFNLTGRRKSYYANPEEDALLFELKL